MLTALQLSEAKGVFQATVRPQEALAADCVIEAGQNENIGASVSSTKTSKLHEACSPFPFVAVYTIVVLPSGKLIPDEKLLEIDKADVSPVAEIAGQLTTASQSPESTEVLILAGQFRLRANSFAVLASSLEPIIKNNINKQR